MSGRLRIIGPLILVIALLLAGAVPAFRGAALNAVEVLARADVGALRAYVLGFGAWAPLVSAGLMIVQAILAPLPSSPVTFVNGLVFGTWWGGLLSWASALVGAGICFWLSRRFGRPLAERLVSPQALAWSDGFFGRFGAHAVLLGRLLPVVSFDVVSYGAGLTGMSFFVFMLATAIGMIPGTLLYSYLGHLGGRSARALLWTIAAITALGVLVLFLKPTLSGRLVAKGRRELMQGNASRLARRALSRAFTRLPVLGRLWARRAPIVRVAGIPWVPFSKPLRACTATLLTTGGVHLRRDRPFDMADPDGDPAFREIPTDVARSDLRITHDYYDHRDADRDINLVFPLERFRELVAAGILGGLTRTHFGFMGHVAGRLIQRLETESIPHLLTRLAAERPDFVFLVPA